MNSAGSLQCENDHHTKFMLQDINDDKCLTIYCHTEETPFFLNIYN